MFRSRQLAGLRGVCIIGTQMPRPAASSREILLLMIAASAANYFGRISISIAGPEIMREHGLSAAQMGTVYSAFAAAYAIAMIPASPLSDRFGPRRVLGMAGLLSSVCLLATALSGLFRAAVAVLPALVAIRCLFGISSAPLYPACGRLSANWFKPERLGRIQGVVVGAGAAGATLAPVLIAALMSRAGWQAAFYIGAFSTGLVFAIWLLRVRDRPSGKPRHMPAIAGATGSWRSLFRNRAILILALSYFCVSYVYDLFDYWAYYYFREVRHFGDAQSAVFTTIAQATAMVAMPAGGWLSDMLASRWLPSLGRRTVPLAALTLSGICLYIGSSAPDAATTVAFFCIAFGLAASVEGAYWATVLQIGGNHAGLAYGVVNAGGNLGGFVSPLVLPRVAAAFGWRAGLVLTSIVAGVAAMSWLLIERRRNETR